MSVEIYRQLCGAMAQRGGRYPGMDIPEFYALTEELFTHEEAAVTAAMPRKPTAALTLAREMGKSEEDIGRILEGMANKGLCSTFERDGLRHYMVPPFVPGIFEFLFMGGTSTARDRKLAKLVHAYKGAVDAIKGPPEVTFPTSRVITVEKAIAAGSKVHTYDQVSSYIEKYDPISVSTCFCRHEAKLIDEKDDCGKPDDVCMQFGSGAQFVIERGLGRRVTKEEAIETLRRSEEAGLVHASLNTQEIDFICNCCPCHCMILKTALYQPKPGRALFSGYQPHFHRDLCITCETCIERCPAKALKMLDDLPEADIDRCFGCGACATGCPVDAVQMEERLGALEPPINRKALSAALGSPNRPVSI